MLFDFFRFGQINVHVILRFDKLFDTDVYLPSAKVKATTVFKLAVYYAAEIGNTTAQVNDYTAIGFVLLIKNHRACFWRFNKHNGFCSEVDKQSFKLLFFVGIYAARNCAQNPDTLISVKDIRRILTGETQRWKDIYPNSKLDDIYLVFDNQNSSTVRYAVDSICNGKPLDNKKVYALKTNPEVIDFVAKTPEAIGVVGVNWLTNHSDSTHLSFRDEVRVMSVSAEDEARVDNSYKPFQAYLYYDDYPLARPIYILLNDPRNGLSWGFSNFLQSDRGQRIILKAGLLPEVLRSYISVNVNEE